MSEAITLTTNDGESLEAELHRAEAPVASVVISHPHPQMGGDMYTPVPAAFFRALDRIGATGIRYNFRGAGRSTGTHDEGRAERLDTLAAIDEVEAAAPGAPIVLAGWSFGADVSLAIDDSRIAGWFLAAAPLRVHDPQTMPAREAASPKRFAVPADDQFAPPATVAERLAGWANTSTQIIPDADHFFAGIMGPVTDAFVDFVIEVIDG